MVIDSSERNFYDIKKEFPSVRWIYCYNKKSKNITLPEQRNIGFKKAQGNIIALIDANCIPVDYWLIELVKPINNEGEIVIASQLNLLTGKLYGVLKKKE